ncbi:Pantoate--beta-alanine ligase [hydrothermal vent metagenome]|uniref:pantoate--beta-alanine ligase (AMP-forming) n=1 Tax=hydrothermal vent metagenome TaxID=652676 RepID=A0A3B0ZWQ2_9ZZZZ
MQQLDNIKALRTLLISWRQAGDRIAFVPTMGDLHAGHLSLVREARKGAERVVVSIFVNPLQFGENEDFDHYPRGLDSDSEKLKFAGVDLLFSPTVSELYPNGQQSVTQVLVPVIGDTLCGASRPGHFSGVATVVSKLLNIVQPDNTLFGEKDFQQLLIIKKLAADLCFPSDIIGVPTCREADGLAMSSRNRYLSDTERELAPALIRELRNAKELIESNPSADFSQLTQQAANTLNNAGFITDYFEIRRATDLAKPNRDDRDLVVIAAAGLGKARLIDNLRVNAE